MKILRVYITGFMGSGKSTLAPIIANTIGWNSIDLDDEIVKSTGMKIPRIFKERGEEYFRTLETQILIECSQKENVVVSLGGGTIARQENFDKIKETGILIYLRSSPEKILLRLKNKTDRPLFQTFDKVNLSEEESLLKIKKLLKEREKFYKIADLTFDIDGITVGKTVDEIVRVLKKKYLLS
jgi:shikimate kinase